MPQNSVHKFSIALIHIAARRLDDPFDPFGQHAQDLLPTIYLPGCDNHQIMALPFLGRNLGQSLQRLALGSLQIS